ncbi:hypothetical protein PHLCEN_2v11578 [Hermanssonia centrifuga]|uniref:Cytochrome P450 n=1 Tax=Hermanssonia centrifuga TaxID=98765 RepID=A0A2R6NJM8_9APHY|nr:hypothetical protein PHLCEN_2v11578 [Hermanssonia centrifuga]
MDNPTLGIYVVAAIIPLFLFFRSLFGSSSLRSIPTVGGPSAPLLSYIGSYRFLHHARAMLQEGYDKYKGGMFKIPLPDRWIVVVTGSRLVDDLQKFPDDHVSFLEAAADLTHINHIFGDEAHHNPLHLTVIRQQLTRQLVTLFPDVRDEISTAFQELIPAKENEWTPINATSVIRQIVARASNRVFVGVPLCRDPGYLDLTVNFAVDVGKARTVLTLSPFFLKS